MNITGGIFPVVTVEEMELTSGMNRRLACRPNPFPLSELKTGWNFNFPTTQNLNLIEKRIEQFATSDPPVLI